MELIIQLALLAFLLSLGLFVGGHAERKHFRSIARRETEMADMLVTQLKTFPNYTVGHTPPCLLVGEAVIATDYLKSFLARIRNIFGGEVRSYQRLLVRARQEAVLRILEQARSQGYNAICNVRLESADVGGSAVNRRGAAMVAIIASATAYHAVRAPA